MYQVLIFHFGTFGNEAKTRTTDGNHSMLTASNYYTADSLPKLPLSHHIILCCYANTSWHAADMLHCRFQVNQIFGVAVTVVAHTNLSLIPYNFTVLPLINWYMPFFQEN